MPAPRLHAAVIANRIVEIIERELSGPMSLKVVSFGALEFYPALENLADNIPAVFVKPSPSTTLECITTAETYKITYNFRIVYVKAFSPNERILLLRTLETELIGELLIDNVKLGEFTITNGQVLKARMTTIEWEPPEDNLVATINANLTASAVLFTVETTTRK
ncbi:MAG: hypothetical protein WCW52_03555 [Elusimicrobiales bacterium]|jgi:hypothetical protein